MCAQHGTPWARPGGRFCRPFEEFAAYKAAHPRRELGPPLAGRRAPQVLLCLDAFYVVQWANQALDGLRARLARELRGQDCGDQAAALGAGMWALRKCPEDLNTGQRTALAHIASANEPLYRGSLIKEQSRVVFAVKGGAGAAVAARCDRVGAPVPDPGVHPAGTDSVAVPEHH